MKKTIVRITILIAYIYIFSFFCYEILPKLADWIHVPTALLGFVIIIALIMYILEPIIEKLTK